MTTRHRLSIRVISAIERRPPHLYECLWCHYFRTRTIDTLLSPSYLCCLLAVATHYEPWTLLATRYESGVLDMYINHPLSLTKPYHRNLVFSVVCGWCNSRLFIGIVILVYEQLWVLPIMPKIPEISAGIQMERLVSVSSDWNIRDHLWRWSTYFGRNIPIEIRRSNYGKPVLCPN